MIRGLKKLQVATKEQNLDNRVVVIVDVIEVLETKRYWYDFRRVSSLHPERFKFMLLHEHGFVRVGGWVKGKRGTLVCVLKSH